VVQTERSTLACAHLLLEWLNERFGARFELQEGAGEALTAWDGAHRLGLYVAPLWESDHAWDGRLRATEGLLDGRGVAGAFLLWVPPQAPLPEDAGFGERVAAAAAALPPGGRTEVSFPVTVRLAKAREEGGYASVAGGLSRWWTRITENVQGTFNVDSRAVHRITRDGEARERLWQRFGEVAAGVSLGETAELEVEEAWTLQRLPEGAPAGFSLIGAPPAVDPSDGILVRRTARKRLAAANEALRGLDVELRVTGLTGCYEYVDVETASGTVKAVDPSLFSRLEVVALLVDGDVRPVFLPRALPWAG
jgi:hypothetical protein